MTTAADSVGSPWLGAYSKFVVCSVLFLIFFGALVKSNDAGLAVPDWPTSYQQGMFQYPPSHWVGGIFFEHVHRLIASAVGLFTFILALWVFFGEKRRSVRYLALFSLLLVIVQGMLGGLTVLYRLPIAVSVSHGVIAQTFMVMLIVLAYAESSEWKKRVAIRTEGAAGKVGVFKHAVIFSCLVYVQLIVAALMRHTDSGLAVLDFPTMGGSWLPLFDGAMLQGVNKLRAEVSLYPVDMFQVSIHILHRTLAALLGLYAFYIGLWCASPKRIRSAKIVFAARLLMVLVVLQFLLGVASVWSLTAPTLTSIHVMVGAMLLAVSCLLALRAFPLDGRNIVR